MTHDDVKDAILQLTVTEHYYTGVQDLVTLLCEFNDISVKVSSQPVGRAFAVCCRVMLQTCHSVRLLQVAQVCTPDCSQHADSHVDCCGWGTHRSCGCG